MTVSHFSLLVSGQIESALLPEHDNLYCKFAVAHGQDWSVIAVRPCIACIFNSQGVEEGITQQSTKTSILSGGDRDAATPPVNVWNFPLDIAFRSTNAFGWPQIIVSVYGSDLLGRDVVRGYGCVHFPRVPGTHTLYVPLFTPQATSALNGILSTVTGKLPEFLDARFVSKHDGREVIRVKSRGAVKLSLHVMTKDFERFGYTVSKPPVVGNKK